MPLGREAIFAALLTSLIATSAFIGVMNFSYKYNALPDFLAPSLPDQINVNSQGVQVSVNQQDYSNTSGWSLNYTILNGNWIQSGSGLSLNSRSLLTRDNVLVKYITPQNGVTTVEYFVNNPSCSGAGSCDAWDVFPRYNYNGATNTNDIYVELSSSSVNVYQGSPCMTGGSIIDCAISLPLLLSSTPVPAISSTGELMTVLDENENTLSVYNYGNRLVYTKIPPKVVIQQGDLLYAGVGTYTTGFTVNKINAQVVAPSSQGTGSNDTGWLSFIVGGISWLTNMFNILIVMAGFTGGALIPGWLTLIIIIPQTLTLALIGAELARGN